MIQHQSTLTRVVPVVAAIWLIGICVWGCSSSNEPAVPELWSARIAMDTVTAYGGHTTPLRVHLTYNPDPPVAIQRVDRLSFAVVYDSNVVTFAGGGRGPDLAGWEYSVGYDTPVPTCPSCAGLAIAQVVAIRDVIDRDTIHDGVVLPSGDIMGLSFRLRSDVELRGKTSQVSFFSGDCLHNFMGDDSARVLHVPSGSGDDISLGPNFDTTSCGPSYSQVVADLAFQNGFVRISGEPAPILKGDVDLDGVAYTVVDFAWFVEFHLRNTNPLSSDQSTRGRQLGGSDVDGDGLPLTIADFERMYRVVFGGVPKDTIVPAMQDTLWLTFETEGYDYSIRSRATAPVTALSIEFEHHGFRGDLGPFSWQNEEDVVVSGATKGDVTRLVAVPDQFTEGYVIGTAENPLMRLIGGDSRFGSLPVVWAVHASTSPGVLMAVETTGLPLRRLGTISPIQNSE